MGFFDFLGKLLFEDEGSNEVTLNTHTSSHDSTRQQLWQMRTALHIVCARYTAMLSKCEVKTYIKGESVKKDNYYLFNLEPNPNQTKAEFMGQVIRRLILSPNHDCLIVCIPDRAGNDRLYVASDFNIGEAQLYEPIFTDVSVNAIGDTILPLSMTFSGKNAIYFKHTSAEIESLFMQMKKMYADIIENDVKAGTYRQKYVLSLDQTAEAQPNFEESMQTLLNEEFEQFIKGDNAVIPLYAGMKVTQTSAGSDLGQNASVADKAIHSATDEVLTKVGLVYNIPRSIMLGLYEADDIDQFLPWCLDPIANMITEAINRKYYGKKAVINGTYCRIDTEQARHFDFVTISKNANNAISSGVYTINGLREKGHEPLIDPAIGDVHFITRNYAVVGEYMEDPSNVIATSGEGDNHGNNTGTVAGGGSHK